MAEVVEIKQENLVYAKPKLITENVMHYCPGCSHGTIHKLVAEVIDEMGMEGKTIAVSPVGCSVFAYNYIDVDWIQAAHGRACAVATAAKRLHPAVWSSPIRVTAICRLSVRVRRFMRLLEARTS